MARVYHLNNPDGKHLVSPHRWDTLSCGTVNVGVGKQVEPDVARLSRLQELLQAHPKELPHPRRQVEVGDPAGHVKQAQAEERHDVADDDPDEEDLGGDTQGRTDRDHRLSETGRFHRHLTVTDHKQPHFHL
jgi:hypothetical protein